jgi:hypothetical protein
MNPWMRLTRQVVHWLTAASFALWPVLSWLGSSQDPVSWGRDALTDYVASRAFRLGARSGTPPRLAHCQDQPERGRF